MKGLTHLYYGDGKGKTTAALGLALRAAGFGKSIVIVQFLKHWKTGELKALAQIPNIRIIRNEPFSGEGKFLHEMNEEEKALLKIRHDESFQKALLLQRDGLCDMLILDEVVEAYQHGVLDFKAFEELLENKPDDLELVLTGHLPDAWILEKADYLTEMIKRKHPYDSGIAARAGIEY